MTRILWTRIKKLSGRIRHYILFAFFRRDVLSLQSSQPKPEPIIVEAVTDETVTYDNRAARIVSEEKVFVEERYENWIAPLKHLSLDSTLEQFKQVAESLPDFSAEGKLFFSPADYLSSVKHKVNDSVEYAHYCKASRQHAIDYTLSILNQTKDENHIVEPSLLLIHNSSVSHSKVTSDK